MTPTKPRVEEDAWYRRNQNWLLWLSLILCTIYDSYRYPFKINSSGTSPTYRDTPFALQIGKFLLVLPLFAASAVRSVFLLFPAKRVLIVLSVVFLSAFAVAKLLETGDSQYLDSCYWMLLALSIVLATESVSAESLDRFFIFILGYGIVSTAVELILFITIGRLPALAFAGKISARFGAFLDDPNGFAALLFLLLGWADLRFQGRRRKVILGTLVLFLVLTQSWTALGFFCLIVAFRFSRVAAKKLWIGIAGISILAIGLIVFINRAMPFHSVLWETLLVAKNGSIQGHQFSWSDWVVRWPDWAFFGASNYHPAESWWAGAFVNFGVPWQLAYAALIGILLVAIKRGQRANHGMAAAVGSGTLLFGWYFAVGSSNLPLPIVFPINFIFFVLAFLFAFDKVEGWGSGSEAGRTTEMQKVEQ